ncbi:MAG: hypothetical protein KBF37_11855 [Saprospiraceae bacterium]|jgi:hypothetical protein|nr:hypothetical protein [Saprospiraceae bacterium]MBV6474191.1 hypothetical protein [Saprospiraceae bacterium]
MQITANFATKVCAMGFRDKLSEKGKQWWRYTRIFMLVLVAVSLALLLFLIFADYSEGSRTGYVTKISHKGYVFKTYEGELNFGFFGGSIAQGQPSENLWRFSVTNRKVATEVEDASKLGQKVTLYYKQKYVKITLRGETEYLVYKIEAHANAPLAEPPKLPPGQSK